MITRIDSDTKLEQMIKESENKQIVLYGAGNYGVNTLKYIRKFYNKDVINFVVTDDADCVGEVEGKPVYSIYKQHIDCILVITASEQKQEEMIETATHQGFNNIYIVLNEFIRYIQSELNEHRLDKKEKLNFEVHITDHCNLNCMGCYHFSPLCQEDYLDVREFERDMRRMAYLCNDQVSAITLLGGEPLLHPDVTAFFDISRKLFRTAVINLLTNGVLLGKMPDSFWESCVENRIGVCCTKYPVYVDYEGIEEKARQYGLKVSYHNDVGAGEKMLIKYPFDLTGTQDIEWNYEHCTRSNKCITLKHGKLYTCPMAAHAHLAKDYFNLDLELAEGDYIDIYQAKSIDDLAEFLIHPIPFCRYCNLQVKPEQLKWKKSEKKLEEWF